MLLEKTPDILWSQILVARCITPPPSETKPEKARWWDRTKTHASNASGFAQVFLSACVLKIRKSADDLLSRGLLAKQDPLTVVQLILPHRSISSFWFPRTPQMIVSLQINYSGEWQLDEANEAATAEISEQRTAHLTSCWLDWVATNHFADLRAEEPPDRKDITITPRTEIVWQTYIIVFLHK